MIKWYAIHLPTYINTKGIEKKPVSMCSSASQDFDLEKLQEKFGVDNVVEIPNQPKIGETYNKASKKIEVLK